MLPHVVVSKASPSLPVPIHFFYHLHFSLRQTLSRFLATMALVNANSLTLTLKTCLSPFPHSYSLSNSSTNIFEVPIQSQHLALSARNRGSPCHLFSAMKNVSIEENVDVAEEVKDVAMGRETVLYSFTPLPLLFVAALPGGKTSCC